MEKKNEKKFVETARGKKRSKLRSNTCDCCQNYFKFIGENRMDEIGRHRSSCNRAQSPEDFWDIGSF